MWLCSWCGSKKECPLPLHALDTETRPKGDKPPITLPRRSCPDVGLWLSVPPSKDMLLCYAVLSAAEVLRDKVPCDIHLAHSHCHGTRPRPQSRMTGQPALVDLSLLVKSVGRRLNGSVLCSYLFRPSVTSETIRHGAFNLKPGGHPGEFTKTYTRVSSRLCYLQVNANCSTPSCICDLTSHAADL